MRTKGGNASTRKHETRVIVPKTESGTARTYSADEVLTAVRSRDPKLPNMLKSLVESGKVNAVIKLAIDMHVSEAVYALAGNESALFSIANSSCWHGERSVAAHELTTMLDRLDQIESIRIALGYGEGSGEMSSPTKELSNALGRLGEARTLEIIRKLLGSSQHAQTEQNQTSVALRNIAMLSPHAIVRKTALDALTQCPNYLSMITGCTFEDTRLDAINELAKKDVIWLAEIIIAGSRRDRTYPYTQNPYADAKIAAARRIWDSIKGNSLARDDERYTYLHCAVAMCHDDTNVREVAFARLKEAMSRPDGSYTTIVNHAIFDDVKALARGELAEIRNSREREQGLVLRELLAP